MSVVALLVTIVTVCQSTPPESIDTYNFIDLDLFANLNLRIPLFINGVEKNVVLDSGSSNVWAFFEGDKQPLNCDPNNQVTAAYVSQSVDIEVCTNNTVEFRQEGRTHTIRDFSVGRARGDSDYQQAHGVSQVAGVGFDSISFFGGETDTNLGDHLQMFSIHANNLYCAYSDPECKFQKSGGAIVGGNTLTIGGFNPKLCPSGGGCDWKKLPLVEPLGYWRLALTGLNVEKQGNLLDGAKTVIVDSGNQPFITFSTALYNKMIKATGVSEYCKESGSTWACEPSALRCTQYGYPRLRPMQFTLGKGDDAVTLTLTPLQYLYPARFGRSSPTLYGLAFTPEETFDYNAHKQNAIVASLGTAFLRAFSPLVYDVKNKQLFVPTNTWPLGRVCKPKYLRMLTDMTDLSDIPGDDVHVTDVHVTDVHVRDEYGQARASDSGDERNERR